MIRVAISYFFFFAIYGALMPFLTPALLDLGYAPSQAGLIMAVLFGFGAFVPLAITQFGDRYSSVDRVLKLAMGALAAASLGTAVSYGSGTPFLLCLFALGLAQSPIIALTDALALDVCDGNARYYTRMRLTGSVGFIVSAVVLGYIIDAFGHGALFPALACLGVGLAINGIFLPKEQKDHHTAQQTTGFWRRLDRGWWLFLAAMMAHWFAFSPYHYGFTVALEDAGVATEWTGWIWALGVAAEVTCFAVAGWFFTRFHFREVLLMAMISNFIRWILVASTSNPLLLAGTQILHGVGFALYYAAAMQGVQYFCENRQRGSFQGLFSSMVGGVAGILGNATSGWLHDWMPMREVFWWIIPVQALAMLLLYQNPSLKREDGQGNRL
jgi:PPP family 3-phenylpropionic acid transporter